VPALRSRGHHFLLLHGRGDWQKHAGHVGWSAAARRGFDGGPVLRKQRAIPLPLCRPRAAVDVSLETSLSAPLLARTSGRVAQSTRAAARTADPCLYGDVLAPFDGVLVLDNFEDVLDPPPPPTPARADVRVPFPTRGSRISTPALHTQLHKSSRRARGGHQPLPCRRHADDSKTFSWCGPQLFRTTSSSAAQRRTHVAPLLRRGDCLLGPCNCLAKAVTPSPGHAAVLNGCARCSERFGARELEAAL